MKLLLLEDDAVLGQGLQVYLQQEGHEVVWCTRLQQAQQRQRTEDFDALLLDWSLPDGSSLSWLSKLRSQNLKTLAIIMTAKDLIQDRIMGLDSGADDYLVKPFAPEELCARLRALNRRVHQAGLGRLHWPQCALEVDLNACSVWLEGQNVSLTAREWRILEVLVRRAGRIVSSSDLEELISGMDDVLESNALQVHIWKLRAKLDPQKTWLTTERGLGYRIVSPA